MSQPPRSREMGFTLIELSILIVILGALLLVAIEAHPHLTERDRLDTTVLTIEQVADTLVSFAAIHARLPCPDVDGDGREGSAGLCATSDVVGAVPYRDLGLADPVLDQAHIPVRYAVYRNPDAAADLAARPVPNRFVPVLPGDPATLTAYTGLPDNPAVVTPSLGINPTRLMPTNRNDLDFCLALRHARVTTSVDHVNTAILDVVPEAVTNVAFVLASGGVEDADGDAVDFAFDGRNEGANQDFESPARRRNDSADPARVYDDLVYAMTLGRLESRLSCAATTVAMTTAANVAIAAAHGLVWGEDALWSAELGRTAALVAQILSDVSLVTTTISLVIAGLDLAILSAGCLGTPMDDDCVGVGFAIAAVALAVVAEGLAIATVVQTANALSAADTALAAAEATVPGLYDHAQKTRIDALAADAHGGQW